jgi:hypothetical protein
MSEIKCNKCTITRSITNCIKLTEQIECKDCKKIKLKDIMSRGRSFYVDGLQEMYRDLGVYGLTFVTSIDPKLRADFNGK